MNFKRGDIVHHKIMGVGVVIDMIQDDENAQALVRMSNGNIERFYVEELETDEVVKARQAARNAEVTEMNRRNAEKIRSMYGL